MEARSQRVSLTPRERFLRACRCLPVDRVPVWMMRQAGRYLPEYRALREKHSFLEVCKTPELASEVSLQPYRSLGVDAVIVFSDILIPAEAMGMSLEIGDAGPILPQPIRDKRGIEGLRDFDPEQETRFLCNTIRLLREELGEQIPVLGFAAAPWTLACYLIEGRHRDGFATAKQFLYAEPALLQRLLGVIARNTARYLQAQIAAGAAAVQLFDTWAGELSRHDYEEFALPATQGVIESLGGTAPVILYTKGSAHLLPSLGRVGADVFSLDWRVDLAEARWYLGATTGLQGNVDPCVLLGPVAGIREAVGQTVDKTGGVGHILNLGHGILPNTPVEHARAFVKAGQSAVLSAATAVSLKGVARP